MRAYHQLYRQDNPRPSALRGTKKQLHDDLYRMLRSFTRPSRNPSSKPTAREESMLRLYPSRTRRGESLTPGIVTPGGKGEIRKAYTSKEAKERESAIAQHQLEAEEEAERKAERRRARPGRAAYGASIVTPGSVGKKKRGKGEKRASGRAFGGISAEHWEAAERAGQTRFERQPEEIDPSEIRAADIVAEKNTSAAWNFLGLITAKLRALAEPTGKQCKAEQSPFGYAPSASAIAKYQGVPLMWKDAERRLAQSEAEMRKDAARARARAKKLSKNPGKRVCLPVDIASTRFEWFNVRDVKKWDHLMSLRTVVKAAIDKRLDSDNLDVILEEALRNLTAAEAKTFHAALKESYARPKPSAKDRKEIALWHAGPTGPWYIKVRDPDRPGKMKRKRVSYEEYRRHALLAGERPAGPHPLGWSPDMPGSAITGEVRLTAEEEIPKGVPQWLVDEMEGRPWSRAELAELETPSPFIQSGTRRSRGHGEAAPPELYPRGRARIGSSPFTPVTPRRAAQMLSELSDEEVEKLGVRKIYKRLLTPKEQEIFLRGRAARIKVSKDPKVRAARQKVDSIRKRLAERAETDAKKREFQRKEMEREEAGKPLTKDEYIWGIEYVAEAKERRAAEGKKDPQRKYEPALADKKLWDGIMEAIEKDGITGRVILVIRHKKKVEQLAFMKAALGNGTPTSSQARAITRTERDIEGLERKLSRKDESLKWKFGPFKRSAKIEGGRRAEKAPDFGAKYGPYIPATDMTKLLLNVGRVTGATGKSDVKVKEEARGLSKKEFEALLKSSGLEGTEEDTRSARTPIGRLMELAKQRQEGDESRIKLIKSKGALRKILTDRERVKMDLDWERKGMGGRKPAVKVTDKALESAKKNLIKRQRKIVNARARTAQLVIYEEMGGREAGYEELLAIRGKEARKSERRGLKREEGVAFQVGRGGFKLRAAYAEDPKPPDASRPWVWMIFEPGSIRRRMISGHSGDKGAAAQAVERAYDFYRGVIQRHEKDKKLIESLDKKLESGEITDEEYDELFQKNGHGGYDALPARTDRRWLRESKPQISKYLAGLLLERAADLKAAAKAEISKGKKDGPNLKMVQYLIRESGLFREGSEEAVSKIKEEQHLRRMAIAEDRTLSGRGYKIKVRKRTKDKWQFQVITSDGRKSTIIRTAGTPKAIEARARSIAGSMMGADKVAKAMTSKNPSASIKRLNTSARKYFRQQNPSRGRKRNSGIPREAAELGNFEDMGAMYHLPADAKEAYKLGYYAGIIKGIDTCGVQNWAKRKKLRKEFEKRMVQGLLQFQERVGVRKAPKSATASFAYDEEPYYEQ